MNIPTVSQDSNLREHTIPSFRVLFAVGFLWGDEGILTSIVSLSEGLIRQGWKVALASPMVDREKAERVTRGPQWIEAQGIKHFYVPFPNNHISGGKNFFTPFHALLKLNTVVTQFRPDVINLHALSLFPYGQVIKLLHRIPYVSTAQIQPSSSRSSVRFGAVINKHFNTFLGDRLIAISAEVQEAYAKDLNVPRENIRLIYHGVDKNKFRSPSLEERLDARATFNLNPDSRVICLIGRLHPIKGHDVLVRALAILRSKNINVIALCAGAGDQSEQDYITKQAEQHRVSDLVRLLGYSHPREVLWASDICVLPSRLEGFGIVIPEAMLCGVVPVRTPAAGAFDQIDDGVNGFIVPFDNPETLALRLEQLLENDELRAQMSQAALKSAQRKFTADKMVEDTISVYKEVIQKKS